MSTLQIALVLLAFLACFLAAGVWVALALGIVAFVGLALFTNTPPGINLFQTFWGSSASWTLAALPLFIWMGEILFRTRLSEEMFKGLAPWLNWLPGRLMHTNVIACGIFGSVSGSSSATCATIAKVALPELERRGYDQRVAIGSLACAATLGILIPPSIIMVVYAVAAEVSIIRIFLAGIIPGFLVMALLSGYIIVWALLNPQLQPPPEPRTTFVEKLRAARNLIPCALLIVLVIWVMIAGFATATEAAAYGVLGALALAAWSKSLSWANFGASLMGATRLSCMIMFILAGASFLTVTMGFTGIPRALAESVAALGLSPYALIAILAVIYVLLGTALDGISMIVLTTSIVIPMIQRAGFDPVWFGIFIVLLVEIAELTPPVGFNLFVLQNMTGRDSFYVARAAIPFFMMLVATIVLVTVFPQIVTFLPDYVMGAPK
ncbi:MAG: TRAP transporter large permease subunit [Proteobacteria bacterium]|nr:TRAP transporter large permease subunit [Burkholderiales bacterium]